MKTTIRESVRGAPDLLAVIERATPWLEGAIGRSAGTVEAIWGLKQNGNGRKELELTLKDWTGSISNAYAPDELSAELNARWRFVRQWGDLLQQDTGRRVEEILQSAAAQTDKD